ncbi:helix-turn-helix transcriptional regulator [Streptomyces sp. DSM 15324]|uniref:helix-turn-helix transcriptional regulator n=1 Tax=Streptomyces sp. DSM 15324 TaxID=1739111 RepID=UPI000A7EA12E|nr:LuxR family transcriptional regulator [Streptomyces sp. DSM 15324]
MTTERMPLVGRDAELALLDGLLTDLVADAAGRPAVLDITGEAGIGKSRLTHELCRRAAGAGATVLRGRATEYERHIPFQPFTDAFADLDPAVPASFPAAEVAPVLTGAARRADRFGLHRATAALLAHAATAPLVMVLDDLHWADPASLELLDHLVRHPPRARVLLAVARRERQSPAPLTATLQRGTDSQAVRRTVLGPLDEQACLERLTPGLDREEAVRLFAASEGNPLYLLALLQAHREGAPVSRLSSTGLGALLLDELTPLGAGQRRLVEVVAALGDHATPALLAPVTGRAPADLAADLAELTRRDLLRPGPHGRLTLRHPVLRSLVHDGTDPWLRTETHRLAAAALARAGAPPAERAHHAERSLSGWDPETADVLIRAAEQAAHTAPASCAHWLGVVLRHLPHTPDRAVRRRDLMLRRARALGACGELRASRDLLHQVIAMPDPAGGAPGDGLAEGTVEEAGGSRASAVVLCAVMERHLGRYSEAVALLRRELHRTDPAPSPADQVALGLELGSSAPHDTSYPTVRADMARTLAVARSLGDEVGVAGALAVAALGEAYEGETADADRYARQAAALVDSLPDDDLTGLCEQLARLGWAEAFLERFADAERHADRGLAIARRTGQLALLPHLLLCKAHVHVQICRPVSAVELAEEAEDIARGIGSDELLAFVLGTKAHAMVAACPPGDPRPVAVAEEAVGAAGLGVNWWASIARCMLGYAALTAGDPARAREAVLHAGGPDLGRLQPSMRPLFLEILVTASLALGEVDAAKDWARRAHEEAERLGLPVQRAAALRSGAHIPLGLGDSRAAAELFVAAAEESARSGALFWEAFSLLLGAPLLAADPDGPRQGRAAWQRGRRVAAAGGSAMLTTLADAVGPTVAEAADGPERRLAELTAREREIAGLVAEGLTSPTIAARLCLSRRTVETHVSRIYRKTGVSSRAALAVLIAARPPGTAFSG